MKPSDIDYGPSAVHRFLNITDSLPDGFLAWQLIVIVSYVITIYIMVNSIKDNESFNKQFLLVTVAMILTDVIGCLFFS